MTNEFGSPASWQFSLRSVGFVVFLLAVNLVGASWSEGQGLLITVPVSCGILAFVGHRRTANTVFTIAVLLVTIALFELSPLVIWLVALQSGALLALLLGRQRMAFIGSLLVAVLSVLFVILWATLIAKFIEFGIIPQ